MSISSVNCSNHLSTATNNFLPLTIMIYDKTAYCYTRGFCVIARLSIFDDKQEINNELQARNRLS